MSLAEKANDRPRNPGNQKGKRRGILDFRYDGPGSGQSTGTNKVTVNDASQVGAAMETNCMILILSPEGDFIRYGVVTSSQLDPRMITGGKKVVSPGLALRGFWAGTGQGLRHG